MTDSPLPDESDRQSGSQSFSSFAGAHNFTIGQQFNGSQGSSIVVTNHHHHHGDRATLVVKLNPTLDASYLRNRQIFPPHSICLPGTREGVLKQITSWAESGMVLRDKPSHVLWVKGALGTGKSAIAQTIADTFARKRRLVASFFFFCGSEDRNHSANLARTLASQLCGAVPAAKGHIDDALEKHAGLLATGSTSWQFLYLFLEPFRASFGSPRRLLEEPYIAVIDGIDECEDRGQVAEFLDQLVRFFTEYPRIPLRFFISSSPKSHIETPIAKSEAQIVNLDQPASNQDLTTLLTATLGAAVRDGKIRVPSSGWPSGRDRDTLVKSANGCFGELVAVLRFIIEPSEDQTSPQERLAFVLEACQSPTSAHFKDQLFSRILTSTQHLPDSHIVISTIALAKKNLSTLEISRFQRINEQRVHGVLRCLHAVVHVPENTDAPVWIYSSPGSFREYLLTVERSGVFAVSPSDRRRIAYRCLELLEADTEQEPAAPYARTYYASHWTASLRDHNKNPEALTSEFGDFIQLVRTVYPKTYLPTLSTYPCLHHDWIASAGGVRMGELVSDLQGPATNSMQLNKALAKCLNHLMDEFPDDDQYTFQNLWAGVDLNPPLPDLPTSTHTSLLERCTKALFRPQDGFPLAFYLPAKLPEHHHYAFGAWCWHLTMAIKHDRDFTREYLTTASNSLGLRSFSKQFDPIRYLSRSKERFGRSGELKAVARSLRSSLDLGISAIDQIMAAPEGLPSYPSSHDWHFRYQSVHDLGDERHWVYGSARADTSVLNMFVGYKAFIECFLMQVEGTHDSAQCTLHVARGRAEEREFRTGARQ